MALSNGRHLAFPFRIGTDGRTAAPASDVAGSGVIQHAQTHQTRAPHHTSRPGCVITFGGNDPGYCGAVALLICDLAAVNHIVPAMHVAVHTSRWIQPLIVDEVGMRKVDAAINDRNHSRSRSGGRFPRASGIHVRPKLTAVLARVAQRPLLVELIIVGKHFVFRNQKIWLNKLDLRIQQHFLGGRARIAPAWQFEFLNTRSAAQIFLLARAMSRQNRLFVTTRNSGAKTHEEFALPVLSVRLFLRRAKASHSGHVSCGNSQR